MPRRTGPTASAKSSAPALAGPGSEPIEVGPGDIAVLRGPDPYTVGEDLASPPRKVITSADYCARAARAVTGGGPAADPRTCGAGAAGSALHRDPRLSGAPGRHVVTASRYGSPCGRGRKGTLTPEWRDPASSCPI
ncbi:cupin domain-containing protein [Streptomyces eurythermus]